MADLTKRQVRDLKLLESLQSDKHLESVRRLICDMSSFAERVGNKEASYTLNKLWWLMEPAGGEGG